MSQQDRPVSRLTRTKNEAKYLLAIVQLAATHVLRGIEATMSAEAKVTVRRNQPRLTNRKKRS
jgi:hypothetical protein